MSIQPSAKKRTTVYISPDVLEYLAVRRARGAGSVSQQLENLVRETMPHTPSREDVAVMEAREVEGYTKKPLEPAELELWQREQVWDER